MAKVKLNKSMGSLWASTAPIIGVDISSSAVKMVELTQSASKSGYMIDRYSIEPLPENVIQNGNVEDLDALSKTIQKAWRRLNTRVKNVCLALPSSAVITKKILLPAGLREADMEYQVESEANQYIPFSIDEVNLDFQVLGASKDNESEVEVLLAASRKANVEDRVAAVQAAGLKAIIVDVETFAAQRAFDLISAQLPDHAEGKTVALVDVGAQMMHINVLHAGHSVYTRDQQIGGELLTQQIQSVYGYTRAEAESMKLNGGLPDGYEAEVLSSFRENLVMEIARALQFFFTSTQFNEIDYIVLTGGCAVLPGLDDAVAARVQVSTLVGNPFALMTLSGRVRPRTLQMDAPALVIACGLAMRRFDPK